MHMDIFLFCGGGCGGVGRTAFSVFSNTLEFGMTYCVERHY